MTTSTLVPARSTLSNGIVVLAKRTRTTPAVTINIALHAGSICDPPDATGAMYLLSKLIDRGTLSPGQRGSMHGEVGQTQFMPKNILAYGSGNLDVAANALNSTANFLKAHGWRAGAGYQPGEPNFGAIQAWNAAEVYERAIALIGHQIDGG